MEGNTLVKLEGDRQHPITSGFACVKMARYPERQQHPQRLTTPQVRTGPKGSGRFQPIGWEPALELIADRLQANIASHGEQSVLPYSYAGTMGLIERDHPLAFFRAIGASELDWTICAATGGTAWEANYGPGKISTAPEDIAHSAFVILWGINAARSNSHLLPLLRQARRGGARIVHIDPYRNETSQFADEHLQIKVGTDAALALAIGGEILRLGFQDQTYLGQYANDLEAYREACAAWPVHRAAEYCGLAASTIRGLATRIGTHKATLIKVGYGMSRNEGGGNAIRAVTLLPALTGAWQHRGGGAALSTSGAFHLNASRYSGKHLLKPNRRHVNQNQLGSVLLSRNQPISSLFIFNSNPAVVAPNTTAVLAGLSREDLFTVVLDHFQTDSADYADVLLPATTFVEHDDIYTSYGHYYLQWADAVAEPLGEARSNRWVFQQLASRMGLTDAIFSMSTEQLAADLLDSPHPYLQGITLNRLKQERSIRLNLPDEFRPYSSGSHFADRKIRFAPAPQQIEFVEQPSEDFPLRMISPPGSHILNSSMGNLDSIIKAAGGEPTVIVNPADAQLANIRDRQTIQIVSENGSIRRRAIVSDDALQGTLIALGQWWSKLAPDGKGLNVLTSERLTDLGGGSTFGNVVVRVEPLPNEDFRD